MLKSSSKSSLSSRETHLSEDRVSALEYTTGLSREDIHAWYVEFLKEFPLGRVGKREFVALIQRNNPLGNAERYAKIVFDAFRPRKQTEIGFDELLAKLFVASSSGSRDDKIRLAFDFFDANKNGKLV